MSTVRATFTGFVGVAGVPVELAEGAEWDSEDPVVRANPAMFTEPKRTAGRPAGSANKPRGGDASDA